MLQSNGPVTLSFPPFRGVTRRIVLLSLALFLLFIPVEIFLPLLAPNLQDMLALRPTLIRHGLIWLPFTFSFAPDSLLSELFAALSFWVFAATLEDEFGSKWLKEFFLVSTAGGALLTCIASYALRSQSALDPNNRAFGLWPAVLAIMLAFARYHGEEELRLYFVIRIKAKILTALYLLFYFLATLMGGERFQAMTALGVALAGWLYLRFAPRRGIGFSLSERWFGVRNAFYRSKRRRAAKKFTVYMKKQGKDVSIDESGRYIDPNGTPRDLNDKRWMN